MRDANRIPAKLNMSLSPVRLCHVEPTAPEGVIRMSNPKPRTVGGITMGSVMRASRMLFPLHFPKARKYAGGNASNGMSTIVLKASFAERRRGSSVIVYSYPYLLLMAVTVGEPRKAANFSAACLFGVLLRIHAFWITIGASFTGTKHPFFPSGVNM